MTQTPQKQSASQSWDAIKAAHDLSGDVSKIQTYYDDWANAYDRDVSNEEYVGPRAIAEFFTRVCQPTQQQQKDQVKILDAGCGTGLVGVVLQDMGYQTIDGFDLSDSMVEIAEQTNSYQDLKGGVDMTRKIDHYDDNQYDASLACGVFTLGHVPPESIEELIRVTRPGGYVVVSTRKSYYDSTNFQEVAEQLQSDNKVKLLEHWKDGPYIQEEGAHYWAFQVR